MPNDGRINIRDNRPPFLMVYNDLYDRYGAQLGPYGLAVYMALCRHANRESECWPSFATIAKEIGASRRKVIYEIQKMERLHIIDVERKPYKASTFVLLDTSAPYAPPTSAPHAPPSAHRAPKQETRTKGTRKKVGSKNYRPDEYSDIILG